MTRDSAHKLSGARTAWGIRLLRAEMRSRLVLPAPFGIVFLAFVLIMVVSCAGKTGFVKVTAIPWKDEHASVGFLVKNWLDYHISYNGLKTDQPRGILFDPKNDDRKITGKRWYPFEDGKTLSDMIGWISSFSRSYPLVQKILGPKDRLFGYIFCDPHYQVPVRALDGKTIRIFELHYETEFRFPPFQFY